MPALRTKYENEVEALMRSLPDSHIAADEDFVVWGKNFVGAMVRFAFRS
jgi:hypothetical protein